MNPPAPQISAKKRKIHNTLELYHEINHEMSLMKRGMINTGNFDTKSKRRTHKSTKSGPGDLTPGAPKNGMAKKRCKGGTPSEGGEKWEC